jgi:hypothetical protein
VGYRRRAHRRRHGGLDLSRLPPLTLEEKRGIVAEYLAGGSLETIGIRLGRSSQKIREALVEAGVVIRPRSSSTGINPHKFRGHRH